MKRCYYCNNFIWPWQNKWLGITPAHASCDAIRFIADTTKLLGPTAAEIQAKLRSVTGYTRPL